jgi:hypothetical protein
MTDVVIIEGDDPQTLNVVETDVQVVEIIAEGPQGATGPRGNTWFHGNGVPGAIVGSVEGDFYVDDLTGITYTQTAVLGTWVQSSNILGTIGAAAAASAAAALASEQAADASEAAALGSAGAAAASAVAADVSADAALVSETNAAASALAASGSAGEASDSAAAALISAGNADTSEAAALASQNAAAASAAAALLSEQAADASEAGALASAGTATTQANNAANSANAASISAAAALVSEGAASGHAAAADADRIAAAASALAASNDAGVATTKAGEAAASALAASGSSTSAGVFASAASDSAIAADGSADAALVSENAAASSAATALTHLQNFRGQYLGPLAADPAVDGNGNAIGEGDLYWNTVANEMRVYDGAAWVAAYIPAAGYATDGEVTQAIADHTAALTSHENFTVRHGFEIEDGAWLATLSYDKNTRVVTVTPTGATFNVWINGKKFTKTGAQAAPAHANTLGGHFVTYDDTGTLQVSTTPWSLTDSSRTPVAFIYWNPTLADGVCFFELHTYERSRQLHANLHATQGTKVVSGFALGDYLLDTATDAAVTPSVGSGVVADEDIFRTNSAVADGGPYTLWYRDTTTGEWKWTTASFPYFYGTYPKYNYDAGGGTGWTTADISNNWFANVWVFVSTAVNSNGQVFFVQPQTQFAAQTDAEAESLANLSWGTMPFQEIAPLYKITIKAQNGGTTGGRIVHVERLLGGGASVVSTSAPSSHGSLSGRSDVASHPATAVSFTPEGTIAATTVQAAIAEVATDAANALGAYLPLNGGTVTGVILLDDAAGIRWRQEDDTTVGFAMQLSGANDNSLLLYNYATARVVASVNPTTDVWDFTFTPTVGGTAVSLATHTHSYLPLSGGNITGRTTITGANGVANEPLVVTQGDHANAWAQTWYNDGSLQYLTLQILATYVNFGSNLPIYLSADSGASVFKVDNGSVYINTTELGYRDVPANVQSGSYTLALSDRGKSIDTTAGVTVPANGTVAFAVGATITITNTSGSNITITAAGGVTLRLAGTATTGNRTLAQYGVAVIRKIATDTWIASGAGLT